MHDREPPAYQEYASDMLARREYRSMTLAERGLLYSMRLECWANRTIPAGPDLLARILGYPEKEIRAALPAVLPFFNAAGNDLFSQELDAYRGKLAAAQKAKIEGGKRGAEVTNRKRRKRGEARE